MSNNHGQRLAGKIAVITGGSSGIGLATAGRLVEEGAHVVITGRRERAQGGRSLYRECHDGRGRRIAHGRSGPALCRGEGETWSHRRSLRERARGQSPRSRPATEAHFDQTFDVNVKGLFFTVQKALPLFKDGGSIILTSSVSNVLGLPGFSAYAASKAAVRNFARGWTLELKDRKIRVDCLSPGAIDTPALATTTGLTAEQAEQAAAQFCADPNGSQRHAEEIAAAVVFLPDESSYITGVDLAVDGGMAQV